MGKALIIAEKPSVATDVSKALGGFKKVDDYYESEEYVACSAVGHLLELTVSDKFEVKRGKWSFANLPVIPDHFDLKPIEKTESRLKLLLRLIKRKDVTEIINACDAGREGELIFRYIMQHAGSEKPVRRLWLQSMTPAAIRDGFGKLRGDQELRPLANAAICRSESDWLVGINGTRAITAFNSKSGGFQLTTVGRVQTPTLAIVVGREEQIKKFVPRDYWEVHATFDARAGSYSGRWFDESFTKEKKDGDSDLKPERLWDPQRAKSIRAKCLGKPGVVSEESKPSSQISPLLFDLTSLQREGNGRFGYSAKRTLQIAQALYERHKVLTYPRTDSRALPEDYPATVREILEMLSGTTYAPFAGEVLKNGWVRPNKRIFNNAKISDHFAIIPTSLAPKNLDDDERRIYDAVTKRFLAVFYPAAEFMITTRVTRVEEEPFKSEGKVMVQAGWMAVYGKEAQAEDSAPRLAPVEPNETVKTSEVAVLDLQTKPPARFSEATLLSAMEGAGKLVDDEELREAMSAKGLGTPATRAAVIEGLILEGYLARLGRELQATAKGISLITLLRGIGVGELCSPELTGDWEYRLKQMERGELRREDFMSQIAEMTRHIVNKTKLYESDTVPGDFATLKAPCPKCGSGMRETYKTYQCAAAACGFSFFKIIAGRQLEVAEAETLLTEKKVGPLQGFKSKMGRPFAAMLKLGAENKVEFDFGEGAGGRSEGESEATDFTGQTPLGKCPKCQAGVFETDMAFICEKATGNPRSCDFRTGKIILQRKISREETTQLLQTGKSPLLHKFISKKGRPFSAYLVAGEGGKVGFEFEPRKPAAAKKPGARKPAAKPPASEGGEA